MRIGIEPDPVELFGVVEQGRQAAGLDVGADALHDPAGGQDLSEDSLGQFPTARRDDIPLRAHLVAKGG